MYRIRVSANIYFILNFYAAGETFLYWYGTDPRICISDPDMAKEILSNKFGFYAKPKTRPPIEAMIGNGLVLVNGIDWVKRRRILNPAFSMDKLKVQSPIFSFLTSFWWFSFLTSSPM